MSPSTPDGQPKTGRTMGRTVGRRDDPATGNPHNWRNRNFRFDWSFRKFQDRWIQAKSLARSICLRDRARLAVQHIPIVITTIPFGTCRTANPNRVFRSIHLMNTALVMWLGHKSSRYVARLGPC